MSFTVRLETDLVSIEAGANTPYSIEITNRGDFLDQYELEIEGLDAEWTAVPVPSFSIPSGEVQSAKIFFKPDRTSENVSGNYPFVIKVRSLETGESRTVQGTLQIKPYFHLSMEILPKKGVYSPTSNNNSFTANLVNLGNSDLSLQLFGSDPEDALAYQFSQEQVTLGPGQQREVEVQANPTQKRPFGSPRLHGFTISARSLEHPSVVAASQAQLEQRPLLSPGMLVFFFLMMALAVGWWRLLPKNPQLDSFSVDRNMVIPGESVVLKWESSHAKSVRILFGDEILVQAGRPNDQLRVIANASGTYTAIAFRDGRKSAPVTLQVTVKSPEKADPPEIAEFEIDKTKLEPGEKFFVRFKTKNAVVVNLAPTGDRLLPNQESVQVEAPDQPGTYDYKLSAVNSAGDVVESKTIRVSVAYSIKVAINSFKADPETVDPAVAKTTITWDASNATKCELRINGKTEALGSVSGSKEIDVLETSTVELVAYDERGLSVRKRVKVTVTKPTKSADDSINIAPSKPPTDEGGSGTTGTTGTTIR